MLRGCGRRSRRSKSGGHTDSQRSAEDSKSAAAGQRDSGARTSTAAAGAGTRRGVEWWLRIVPAAARALGCRWRQTDGNPKSAKQSSQKGKRRAAARTGKRNGNGRQRSATKEAASNSHATRNGATAGTGEQRTTGSNTSSNIKGERSRGDALSLLRIDVNGGAGRGWESEKERPRCPSHSDPSGGELGRTTAKHSARRRLHCRAQLGVV